MTGQNEAPGQATPQGWHVKRELQIGHLLTTVTIAVAAVLYITKIDQRIAVLEVAMQTQGAAQKERDERQDRVATEGLGLVRQDIREVNSKLDRLIEKKIRP